MFEWWKWWHSWVWPIRPVALRIITAPHEHLSDSESPFGWHRCFLIGFHVWPKRLASALPTIPIAKWAMHKTMMHFSRPDETGINTISVAFESSGWIWYATWWIGHRISCHVFVVSFVFDRWILCPIFFLFFGYKYAELLVTWMNDVLLLLNRTENWIYWTESTTWITHSLTSTNTTPHSFSHSNRSPSSFELNLHNSFLVCFPFSFSTISTRNDVFAVVFFVLFVLKKLFFWVWLCRRHTSLYVDEMPFAHWNCMTNSD